MFVCLFSSCVTFTVAAPCLFADAVCSGGFMEEAAACSHMGCVLIWVLWVVKVWWLVTVSQSGECWQHLRWDNLTEMFYVFVRFQPGSWKPTRTWLRWASLKRRCVSSRHGSPSPSLGSLTSLLSESSSLALSASDIGCACSTFTLLLCRFQGGKRDELIGITYNRLIRMDASTGDAIKTWRFSNMKQWNVNWEIKMVGGHLSAVVDQTFKSVKF